MRKSNQYLPAIILCIICLATTGLLALTYSITQNARDTQAAAAANANRQQLYPDANAFDDLIEKSGTELPVGLLEAYEAKNGQGDILGYLFVAEFAGYGGNVPIMLAIGPDATISGIKILNNDETPGLGKKVSGESFYSQFISQPVQNDFSVKASAANYTRIDAITGATISSRAVTEAVNIAVKYYREQIAEVKK